jgi:anti-sigma factor RsiW
MNCTEVKSHLLDYIDGSLHESVRSLVNQHVSGCSPCASLLEGFTAMGTTIEREKALEPNPFTSTRILQHISATLDQRRFRPVPVYQRILQPALITVSLLLALFTGYILGKHEAPGIRSGLAGKSQVEILKSELFINDFIDEDKSLSGNK